MKFTRFVLILITSCSLLSIVRAQTTSDWPSFRGLGGRGVAENAAVRTQWNADKERGELDGVLWETEVPGLGHSSPVIFGNRIFLLTAIPDDGKATLNVNAGGSPAAADDDGSQSWVVLCYDKTTGQEIWRKTAHQGNPKSTRHTKATHANTSVCVDGENVVAFFGSEGLYCYDMQGELRWSRDLGIVNVSKYGVGWGFASSPIIHGDRIVIVCDDPDHPYVAVLRLDTGDELWRVSRQGVCERSWGTPMIHTDDEATQAIVNGWPWIVSYDLNTGEELWRLEGGGDNPVPTPFEAHGWIYITNSHGGQAPIYVVRPSARGTLSTGDSQDDGTSDTADDPLVWRTKLGGSYMSTPVVYGDYLYLGNSNGTVRCFHAKNGQSFYEKRLGRDAGIVASLVAADEKVYFPSENGTVYVLRAGESFEVLAENPMGEPCFASPAISDGVIYFRTTKRLIAIK